MYDLIDWSKAVNHTTDKFCGEDILTLEYDNCLIELGWHSYPGGYNNPNGFFTIKIIIPRGHDLEDKYSPEDWGRPFVEIPCPNQWDMQMQLQRAIDTYPLLTNKIVAQNAIDKQRNETQTGDKADE